MENDKVLDATRPYADFGERLWRAMDEKRISGPKLAGILEISSQMVGRYLRGESLPGPERLTVIAKVVEVDMLELLGGHHYPSPGRRPRSAPIHQAISRGSRSGAIAADTARSLALIVPDEAHAAGIRVGLTAKPSTEPDFQPELFSAPEVENLGLTNGVLHSAGGLLGVSPRENLTNERWDALRKLERDLSLTVRDVLREYFLASPVLSAAQSLTDLDLEVVANMRIRGPYFRGVIDVVVTRRGEPLIGIEIVSGLGAKIPSLTGAAANWKAATGGKPFIVLFAVPTTSEDDLREARVRKDMSLLVAPEKDAPKLVDACYTISLFNPAAGLTEFFGYIPELLDKALIH